MDPLPDPLNDRPVKHVTPPPGRPLDRDMLYPGGSQIPDWKVLRDHLFREGRLYKEDLLELVKSACDVFSQENNLLKLKDPITVVGDIHGQYFDFVKLLEVGGDPSTTQYLFLGDYVDRGSFSIEVLLLIFTLKLNFPKTCHLLRGNHECRQMTAFFNFRDECEYKYDPTVYKAFMDAFDSLPICGILNGKFLGVHGGISPELKTLKQLDKIDRFQEPPRSGLLCDLLWSDPVEEKEDTYVSRHASRYVPNEVRGCSYFFSYDAVIDLMETNPGLLSIIRAHEAQLEGYKMHKTNEKTQFPTVITIFSAPNYCDVYNNKGAILKFENNTLNILQFNFSVHPYHLPNFMDVFTWSIPFVSEKVTEMLYYILHPSSLEDDEDEDVLQDLPPTIQKVVRKSLSMDQNQAVELAARLQQRIEEKGTRVGCKDPDAANSTGMSKERADRLRNKVRTAARLMRMYKTMRQENETFVKLGGITPGAGLNPGALIAAKNLSDDEKFAQFKSIDLENEKRPDLSGSGNAPEED